MSKGVDVDCSPESHQEIDTLFTLDRCPAYPSHIPAFHSALRPDPPSDCALLRINYGHLKCETTTNILLSTCLGDESVFYIVLHPTLSFTRHHINHPCARLMHSTHVLEDSPCTLPFPGTIPQSH